MSIVLNEYKWAENALREKVLGNKPYETLTRISKYYTYNGLSKRDVRKRLEEFLISCDKALSVITWSNTLDSAAKYATKYPLVVIDHIDITKSEMKKIEGLSGKQLQRLAFTLLCIAKYMGIVYPHTDYWVNTPDNEIMKMANINTSIKRQSLMYSQLRDAGLIRFSKRIDNLSVQVLFVEDGDVAMSVSDFRNLGYQYMKFHGEPYYVCKNCGLVCKARDNTYVTRMKYCCDCAVKIKTQQNVNSVMRNRSRAT